MTDGAVEDAVVSLRKLHPTWGPKKLRGWLLDHQVGMELPATSTIGDILTRRGLTAARKRRLRVPPSPTHLTQATCPNAVWTTDHKGSFRLSEGRCYPLTLMDAWSRYFLKCEALSSTSEDAAFPHYEAAFREFGLPARIRSDNGVPFANANTPGRLSRLSIWWVKLGIGLERIEPGHPEQNGQHERMHRTLEEAIDAGKHDMVEQQRRFDAFRREWNQERPHEALGQRCPARVYETSWRPYPAVVRPPEYGPGVHVRSVASVGTVSWRGHSFSVGKVLAGERVGFQELDDDRWAVRFGPVWLCTVHVEGDELKVGMKPGDRPSTAEQPGVEGAQGGP
jgi:transposase InsO family protein